MPAGFTLKVTVLGLPSRLMPAVGVKLSHGAEPALAVKDTGSPFVPIETVWGGGRPGWSVW
jgi:hypothetical protein